MPKGLDRLRSRARARSLRRQLRRSATRPALPPRDRVLPWVACAAGRSYAFEPLNPLQMHSSARPRSGARIVEAHRNALDERPKETTKFKAGLAEVAAKKAQCEDLSRQATVVGDKLAANLALIHGYDYLIEREERRDESGCGEFELF